MIKNDAGLLADRMLSHPFALGFQSKKEVIIRVLGGKRLREHEGMCDVGVSVGRLRDSPYDLQLVLGRIYGRALFEEDRPDAVVTVRPQRMHNPDLTKRLNILSQSLVGATDVAQQLRSPLVLLSLLERTGYTPDEIRVRATYPLLTAPGTDPHVLRAWELANVSFHEIRSEFGGWRPSTEKAYQNVSLPFS